MSFFHKWATRSDWCILDTETTGTSKTDQVLEVCAIGAEGEVLISSLIKVTCPISPHALAVHGVRKSDLRGAPTFPEIAPLLLAAMKGRHVLAYNSPFDQRLLRQSWKAHTGLKGRIDDHIAPIDRWQCVMAAFTRYHGTRVGLSEACRIAGLAVDLQHMDRHRAYGDCFLTHRLIHKVGTVI